MATAHVQAPPEIELIAPDGYELIDGIKVRKPVSEKSCWVAGELLLLIGIFLRQNPIGRVYPGDTSFRCFPGRPRHIRKPDVAFIRADRLAPDLSDTDIQIRPDLVVEVISPREKARDLDGKIQDFRSVGVPLIWVVNPNNRTVRIIRADGSSPPMLGENDTLDGGDVLPGFSCRVADFLSPPPPAAP